VLFLANAEYIKMADHYVPVPGGTNNNNYANVELILDIAKRMQVSLDATKRISSAKLSNCVNRSKPCGPDGVTRRKIPNCPNC
jgi:hypothetical protein